MVAFESDKPAHLTFGHTRISHEAHVRIPTQLHAIRQQTGAAAHHGQEQRLQA
jgi:hypothetical protein